MRADGVWRIEQLSIDGWEPAGVAFFGNGKYMRGGVDAYTIGEYELDGDRITITATTTRFGSGSTVYGTRSGEVEITLTGKVKDGKMTADATDGKYVTSYRYKRVGDMPKG